MLVCPVKAALFLACWRAGDDRDLPVSFIYSLSIIYLFMVLGMSPGYARQA
jgi:hypothetical protein